MTRAATILIVDDETYVRESLVAVLRRRGHDARGAESAQEALRALAEASFDAVLTDLKMTGATGLELLQRIQAISPGLPVVVLTGHGTVLSAVECMKAGAFDYLLKPADPDQLALILERAVEGGSIKRELEYLRTDRDEAEEEIVGRSDAWRRVMELVDAAAPAASTVLLAGESGTGKEVLARRIHRRSPRASGPFVRVNCAAIPLELFESEFFGYRKGAFTGAASDRDGRFRVADGGTLFMDEVGAMAESAQAKILRVLQDGEFERVGDTRPTRVDVRLIAATNVVLEDAVRAGRFRSDLFYRLNVVQVRVPALRERRDDIPPLAAHFLRLLAPRVGRRLESVEPEALRLLQEYDWPGNVRELRNVIERGLILERGRALSPASLALPGAPGTPPSSSSAGAPGGAGSAEDLNLRAALGVREREILIEALKRAKGVRKEAARLLGIDQRNLSYYLRKHELDPEALPG